MIAATVRRMTIVHRLPYAITRVDDGSQAAAWDLKQCSVRWLDAGTPQQRRI
jgi:hypothetical protein